MASCGSGHYIVTLEEDKEIFNVVLLSMNKGTPTMVIAEVAKLLPEVLASQDPP
jgi:hypothetical protein